MAVFDSIRNLELIHRMALSHIVYCSAKALRCHSQEEADRYEEEIRMAEEMSAAVAFSIKNIKSTEEG
jgi:hypothetical protein